MSWMRANFYASLQMHFQFTIVQLILWNGFITIFDKIYVRWIERESIKWIGLVSFAAVLHDSKYVCLEGWNFTSIFRVEFGQNQPIDQNDRKYN